MDHGAWYLVGPLMGVVIVGLLWATNRPLGALGGDVDLQAWARKPSDRLGWRAFFLGGVVLGGLVASLVAGGPHPSFPDDLHGFTGLGPQAALLVTAGVLMGCSARTAGGCTSGHGLSGSALASPASWVACGTFMATAIAVENLLLRGAW